MRLLTMALLAGALVTPAMTQTKPASPDTKKMTPPSPAAPRPFEFPKFTSKKLANGLTVFVVEDRRLPLVSYALQVLAGNLNVKPEQSGLPSMTAALLREGTATRSSQQIAQLVDQAGGSLEANAGDDVTTVSAAFMKTYADLGLELLADVVLRPKFDQEEIDRQMEQAQSGLAVQYNDPEYLLPLVAARAVYGTHPYAYPGDGTPQSLRNFGRDDIVAFHKSNYAPSRAWLAIAGDIDPEEAFKKAEKYFGAWKVDGVAMPSPAAPPAPRAQVLVVDKPDAVQTQISVGHLGVARNHPDYLTLQVANQIFGGSFNSRVNMKLRANEGLTYGAGSSFRSERLAGVFGVNTFTRTEKTAEAIAMIFDLVKEWKANPATAAELAEAKAFMTGSYGVALETSGAVASRVLAQAVHRLPEDYFTRYRERVQALTLEHVKAAVERHIQPDKLAVVAVGNASEFPKALEKFGPVRVIPLADLDPVAPEMVRVKETVVSSAEGMAKGKVLMEAAAAAMGGKEKLLALKDLTQKGRIKLNTPQGALEGEATESVLYPDKYKLTMSLMGTTMVQSGDGQSAYAAQGPMTQDLPPQFAKELAKGAYTMGGVGLVRAALDGGAEVLALAPSEVEGRQAETVLWKRDDFEVKIFLDPASGRILKLNYRSLGMQGPAESDVLFGAYTDHGGLKLPGSETIFQNGAKFGERTIDSRELNSGMDASAFRKPAQ